MKMIKVVKVLNLPRELCHHLVGEEHKVSHRMIVGGVVMASGVLIAHSAQGMPHIIMVCGDMVGYGIHALGAAPYIEWLLEE